MFVLPTVLEKGETMRSLIIHIATTFQSFKALPHEIQETIWQAAKRRAEKETQNPVNRTTLEDYLSKKTPDLVQINSLLKTQMALSPNFGQIIAVGRGLYEPAEKSLKIKTDIAANRNDEKEILKLFWQNLDAFIGRRGTPTFVTWNGLEFTFPFLIQRSAFHHLAPTCILPKARYQPWRHLDLMAELANYDHHNYISLETRATLWNLNKTKSPKCEEINSEWEKGNNRPLKEKLQGQIETIGEILKIMTPFFTDSRSQTA